MKKKENAAFKNIATKLFDVESGRSTKILFVGYWRGEKAGKPPSSSGRTL